MAETKNRSRQEEGRRETVGEELPELQEVSGNGEGKEGAEGPNSVKTLLGDAVKKVTDEIEFCEGQINKFESRKTVLQEQLRGAMADLQAQFGLKVQGRGRPPKNRANDSQRKTTQRSGRNGTKSTRSLILEYLESNEEARTSEIRQFLEDSGKSTNPGVELSRMVKDKAIRNVERGVYRLAKR